VGPCRFGRCMRLDVLNISQHVMQERRRNGWLSEWSYLATHDGAEASPPVRLARRLGRAPAHHAGSALAYCQFRFVAVAGIGERVCARSSRRRRQVWRKFDSKSPHPIQWLRAWNSLDGDTMQVICPTCQTFSCRPATSWSDLRRKLRARIQHMRAQLSADPIATISGSETDRRSDRRTNPRHRQQ